MIQFNKVKIEGFASILDMEFEFKPGLNVIKASNGVGKTSIFNAWYWCLTGDTLKPKCSINTWDYIRPNDYQGTKVQVYFNIGDNQYEVIRCQDYRGNVHGGKGNNRLVIVENGAYLNIKGKSQNQKYLLNLLGYSSELLKNTLVFGQKLKRLIDESGTNKKEILEEAFEISFINAVQEKVKKRKANKLSEFSPLRLELETLLSKLEGKREALLLTITHKDQRDADLKKQIETEEKRINDIKRDRDLKASMNNEEDLKGLKRRIFEYDRLIKKFDSKRTKYYQISGEIGSLIAQISDIESKIDKEKLLVKDIRKKIKSPEKTCVWCGQELKGDSKEKSKKNFQSELKNLKTGIKELENKYNGLKEKLDNKNRQLSSLKEVISQYNIATNNKKELEEEAQVISQELISIEQYDMFIKDAQNNLRTLKDGLYSNDFTLKITRMKLEIRKLKKKIKPLKKEVEVRNRELTILDWLIKDPLSNSGLKSFIFNDMIHLLNERMAHYSHPFGIKVEFDVDLESARKDINAFVFKDDEIISYYDLSGGQAQFVAVIMAFGLHDIVAKETKATNLLLMDEIFESLSSDNVEKVMELIRSKLGGISINLVTHRNEFNPYNSRIVRLKLENGQTKAINL